MELEGARATITEVVSDEGVLSGLVGGEIWRCSFMLALLILRHPALQQRSLCEVGAGTGLVGLIAARMGLQLTITDVVPSLLKNLEESVSDNERVHGIFPGQRPHIAALDWEDWALGVDAPAVDSLPGAPYDVILGSELVYTPHHHCLADVLHRLLKPYVSSEACTEWGGSRGNVTVSVEGLWSLMQPPCAIIVQHGDRPGFSTFLERCEALGLVFNLTPAPQLGLGWEFEGTRFASADMTGAVLCVIRNPPSEDGDVLW